MELGITDGNNGRLTRSWVRMMYYIAPVVLSGWKKEPPNKLVATMGEKYVTCSLVTCWHFKVLH